MQDQSSAVPFSPSFSSYSHHISSVAARVREEEETRDGVADSDRSDSEFEFVLDRPGAGASSPPAIPLPLFDRGLLTDGVNPPASPSRLVSLGKLFIEEEIGEDRPYSSDSESETEEVDEIPLDAYCIWKPRASPSPSPSPDRCKKSNSTGSSASAPPSSSKPKWRIRDLLRRSRSDGKESYVFLTRPNQNPKKDKVEEAIKSPPPASKGKAKGKVPVSAHEALYVRNKAQRDVDKRRSYLPYRQDLVGFFSTVNGLGRNFPPFA